MTVLSTPTPQDSNPFRHHFKFRFIILYFFAISIALGVVLGGILTADPELSQESFSQIILISNSAVMVLLCLLLIAKMVGFNMHVRDLVGSFPKNRSCWLLAMVLPVLLFSVGSGQIYFYTVAQLFPERALELIGGSVDLPTSQSSVWNVVVSAVTVAIIVPITEEFLFRGVLLHRWATKMGVLPGVIASSIFFGILHPNPIGLSVFGLVTSLIYLKTRSLWLVTAFHAINNGTVVGLGLLSSPSAPQNAEAVMQQLQTEWLVGCLLVLLSAPILLYFTAVFWPHHTARLPYFENNMKRIQPPPVIGGNVK